MTYATVLEAAVALCMALVLVGATTRYARRRGVVDVPTERSSHAVPTPRGGGFGLILAIVTASVVAAPVRRPPAAILLLLVGATLLLTLTGWIDDHRSVSVHARLVVHAACGLAVALFASATHDWSMWRGVLWCGAWTLWTMVMINFVNFMDGIDGIIGAQGVVYGAYVAIAAGVASAAGALGVGVALASAGFLFWNWAPARIFMGDSGSGSLGFLFVVAGALALNRVPLALVYLPLLPLVLDAAATLLRRAIRRERVTVAHRGHLYQRLANGVYGHARVALGYAIASAIGGMVSLAAQSWRRTGAVASIAAYVAAVLAAYFILDWRVEHSGALTTTNVARDA